MKSKLTVLIPTYSKDIDILRRALNSVLWADEILIADSSKTEAGKKRMKEIANEFRANYIFREYRYSADFKNWAIPQAKNEWILLLDSDEVVTKKLTKKIKQILNSKEIVNYDGFGIARKHFFFGKFLKHGGRYPLYNVRLFRKNFYYEDRDVHAHIVLKKERMGTILPKDGDILHYSDCDFSDFFERFDRYSTYQANYMKKIASRGLRVDCKEFFINFIYFKSVIKDIWFFVPGSSLMRFFWMYFFRLGFLDGKGGLMIATLYSLQDYVSKTKYFYLKGSKRNVLRNKLQSWAISLISKSLVQKEYFVESYNRNLSFYKLK